MLDNADLARLREHVDGYEMRRGESAGGRLLEQIGSNVS